MNDRADQAIDAGIREYLRAMATLVVATTIFVTLDGSDWLAALIAVFCLTTLKPWSPR